MPHIFNMILELNEEVCTSILKVLRVINTISIYDPNFYINLSFLKFNSFLSAQTLDTKDTDLISDFIVKNSELNSFSIDNKEDLFNFITNSELIDSTIEAFCSDYGSCSLLSLEEIQANETVFNDFLNYLEDYYKIACYSIESEILKYDTDATKDFVNLLPVYLASYLGIFDCYYYFSNFTLNETKDKGICTFYLDISNSGDDIKNCFEENQVSKLVDYFEINMNQFKKATNS